MCIENIRTYKESYEGIGYKLFGKNEAGDLTGDWSGVKPRPIGKWLKERDYRNDRDPTFHHGISDSPYDRNEREIHGWGIFKNKKDAWRWWLSSSCKGRTLYRVKFRKANFKGKIFLSNYAQCFIAREIFILEEISI